MASVAAPALTPIATHHGDGFVRRAEPIACWRRDKDEDDQAEHGPEVAPLHDPACTATRSKSHVPTTTQR